MPERALQGRLIAGVEIKSQAAHLDGHQSEDLGLFCRQPHAHPLGKGQQAQLLLLVAPHCHCFGLTRPLQTGSRSSNEWTTS